MAMAFMLVMATMANAWNRAQEDSDEDSLELPELRALEADDDLFFEARKLHPYNTKNVSK
jgi:hypothetical protein